MSHDVEMVQVVECPFSDHEAQILHLKKDVQNLKTINNNKEMKRIFSEKNKNHFYDLLSHEKWESVYNCSNDDINSIFNVFHEKFVSHFDKAFPFVESTHNSDKYKNNKKKKKKKSDQFYDSWSINISEKD
jgi:hypothetical protein